MSLPPVTDAIPTWEDVARTHGRFLYTVAYRLTGNDDDAQDLVQDTLLRVRRGLAGYQPGNFEAWLARICTNVFLDDVRRRRRRPVGFLPDDPDRVMTPAPAADEASTMLPRDLELAVAGLPDEFRAAVVLCDVAGLSYEDIAVALGIPVGTVRSRIHRGRKILRAALTGMSR